MGNKFQLIGVTFLVISFLAVAQNRTNQTSQTIQTEPEVIIKWGWRDNEVLNQIIEKDLQEIQRIYGAVGMLKNLKANIPKEVYEDKLREQRKKLSAYLEYDIKSADEMEALFKFFISQKPISTADKIKSMFSFANILLIIAIIITVIALGSVGIIWIVPLIEKMSTSIKIIILYTLSAAIIASGFYCSPIYSVFVGFFGSLCFGGAYTYHLSTLEHHDQIPAIIFAPPFLVWSILAIAYHSRLIGFISIMAFASMIGFSMWVGPLCTAIGFEQEEYVGKAIPPSFALIAMYVARALGAFTAFSYYFEPFDSGVFFVGTFVYFTALLIRSSKWFSDKGAVYFNILAIFSGLVVAALGFLVEDLSVFRGVGLTFFVIFLMQKYVEIPWGEFWSCGLLGGGILLIAICLAIKQYGTYFVFWNY